MEINRTFIKSCQRLVKKKTIMEGCDDILCSECPFAHFHSSDGNCCCGNSFYKGSWGGRIARAQEYLKECREELENRFKRLIDYCDGQQCRECKIKDICDEFDMLTRDVCGFTYRRWSTVDELINEIMEGA